MGRREEPFQMRAGVVDVSSPAERDPREKREKAGEGSR